MITIRKFTEGDYMAFSGVEGNDPRIGDISVYGKGDGVIIADTNVIQIFLETDANGGQEWWHLDGDFDSLAEILPQTITEEVLNALDFVKG